MEGPSQGMGSKEVAGSLRDRDPGLQSEESVAGRKQINASPGEARFQFFMPLRLQDQYTLAALLVLLWILTGVGHWFRGEPAADAVEIIHPREPVQYCVDLNTADMREFAALPGIGPKMARRIVQWRAEHGHFGTIMELTDVRGIGDKLLARMLPYVRAGQHRPAEIAHSANEGLSVR